MRLTHLLVACVLSGVLGLYVANALRLSPSIVPVVPVPDSRVTDSLAAVTDSLARQYTADSARWEAERAEAQAARADAEARAQRATRRAAVARDSLAARLDSTEARMFVDYQEERDSIDAAMEQVVEAVQLRALTAEADRDALLLERTGWYAERTALREENRALRAAYDAEHALRLAIERDAQPSLIDRVGDFAIKGLAAKEAFDQLKRTAS